MSSIFLNNLAESCRHEGVIRADGTQRSVFGAVCDFFNKRAASEDFESICKTLSGADISALSMKKRTLILARIKQIAGKLNNNICSEEILEYEKKVFHGWNDKEIYAFTERLFKQVHTPFEGRAIQRIGAIVEHYDNAPLLTELYNDTFIPFYNKTLGKKGYKTTRLFLLKLFMTHHNSKIFLSTCFAYLSLLSRSPSEQEREEVVRHIEKFGDHLDGARPEEVKEELEHLQSLFDHFLFRRSLHLNENNRSYYEIFSHFIPIIEKHIGKADDAVKQRLKIQLANLPPLDTEQHLTDAECQEAIVAHFKKKEEEALAKILKQREFSQHELRHLQKLEPQHPALREHLQGLRETLSTSLKTDDSAAFQELMRATKARAVFEEGGTIPRWYHATNMKGIQGIIQSEELQVRAKGASLRGAWVSTHVERGFGKHVLAFKNVTDIGPMKIGYQHHDRRWRGLQTPISLDQKLAYVAAPTRAEKDTLREEFSDVRVFSTNQLVYMRQGVAEAIGYPNLPQEWWGL